MPGKYSYAPDVAAAFERYPETIRRSLMVLRKLILETAKQTPGVGEIEETLKWGQPSYLTSQTKSGSTIRIDWRGEDEYAIYFHCQTNLVETFRTLFPDDFRFDGNRSMIFTTSKPVPKDALRYCIEAALTYHLKQKSARSTRRLGGAKRYPTR